LNEDALKKLLEAGRIARIVREEASRLAQPGTKLLDLANFIEQRIRELGGEPAFPANLGVNEIAAHYTPIPGDDLVIPESSVLKIDIGVHVDGYIADTAVTITFNPAYEGLVEATRKALEKAIEVLKPDVRASDVGRVIEETVKSCGYKVIKNLSGHSIDRYTIHSGVSIPNYNEVFNRARLSEGVYAIEPFATNGYGLVVSSPQITIYALKSYGKKALPESAKKLADRVWSERKTLPFCERWYVNTFSSIEELNDSLKMLEKKGMLIKYPVLIEKARGVVSQHEHTVVITGKDVIVTTA